MLPKTVEYSLRAVVWLARTPGQAASADQLARATQVPRRYLHKVLQDLGRAGLVRSQPGPGGGYALNGNPKKITLLDVIRAAGGIERIRQCPLGLATHTSLCPLHQELDRAYEHMEQSFARVTIADVVDQPGRHAPLCESP